MIFFLWLPRVSAQELSPLYVDIADATSALDVGNMSEVNRLMLRVQQQFDMIADGSHAEADQVKETLQVENWDQTSIIAVTKALVSYEKSLNPVDLNEQRQQFLQEITPLMTNFATVLTQETQENIREGYLQLNKGWTVSEGLLRDYEPGFYGKIETQLALLRVAIEDSPFQIEAVATQFETLQKIIAQLQSGVVLESSGNQYTLDEGIVVLENALVAFKQQDKIKGTQEMQRFIEMWPTIEGNISTQNAQLYNQIEAESPVIMANGLELEYQQQLATIIEAMKAIDPNRQYNRYDVGIIILREGLEALLIIAALMSSVVALGDKRGKLAIIQGSVIGLLGSVVVAGILGMALPLLFASVAREVLEGIVGIIAVFMMLVVGIWLHRRSTLKTWQRYLDQQMSRYQKSGRLYVLIGLSALAVFREGAESILFLVGIVPNITWSELIIGISGATMILVLCWLLFRIFANKFQPYRLFGILSWFIYALTFKMFGVSIYKLQFTKILPTHSLSNIPAIRSLGIYPSVESLVSQILLVMLIVVTIWWSYREQKD